MSVIGGPNTPTTNGLAYIIDFNNNYISGSSTVTPILYLPTASQFTGSVPNLVNGQVQFTGSSVLRSFQTFPGFSATQGNMTLMFSGESKNSNVLFTQDGTVAVVSTTSSIGYGVPAGNLGRNFPNTGFDHVTLRFSSASVDCFVNGIPVSASGIFPTVPSSSTFNDFKIGGNYINAWTGSFSGSLGQLMVYNRVLSDDEIYSNYLIQARRYGLPEIPKPYTVDSSVYVYTQAAGITGSSTISALNTFVSGLKTAGLWDKMIAIYPFIGTSPSGSRLNLKDVSLNTTQVNYSGSWSTSLSGSYNNNTASYGILSNITPTYVHPLINSQSIHLSYLSYDTPVSGGYLMGVEQIPGLPGDIAAPAAAYSVRKVRTAYTGSALRVRRDSDDLSFDVGFDASGNLNTGSLLTNMTASLNTPALPGDYSGLAAAYSLRRVSSSYSGYAIEVRRAVDNYSASIGFDGSGNLNTASLASFIRTGSEVPVSTYSGLAAAYSLRKVVTTYTGSAIEIQSGSVSQSIGFTANGDLDIAAIRTFAGTGTAGIKTWYDQSGNNYHATQSSAGNQPLIYSGSQLYDNGKPTLWFRNQQLRLISPYIANPPFSIFHVFTSRTGEANSRIYIGGDGFKWYITNVGSSDINYNSSGGSVPLAQTFDQQFLHFTLFSGSASGVGRNDGSFNIRTTSTTPANAITVIGDAVAGGSNCLNNSYISEILIYNTDQTPNRTYIQNNINSYYGIYTPSSATTESAFVKTWYDQSGNNYHATQAVTSSQPLIVDNGVIVTENGKPALSFNGVNDFLTSSFTYNINTLGIQKVERWRNLNNGQVSTNFSPTSGPYLQWIQNNQTFENYYIGAQTDSPATTARKLYSFYTRLGFYENGTLTVSRPNVSSETVNSVVIGAYGESILPASVNTQELIIYSSNITSSKGLIEDNINGYYNIFTQSLASGSGYVTTWYDQSGNNRHATQSVAASQPLILSSGSITTSGGIPSPLWPSFNQFLSLPGLTTVQSVFHVSQLTNASGPNTFILGDTSAFDYHGGNGTWLLSGTFATFGVNYINGVAENFATKTRDTKRNILTLIHNTPAGRVSLITRDRTFTDRGWLGYIQELVLYTSNQTGNRQGIEYNINSYFNIYTQPVYNVNSNSLSLFSSPTVIAGAANASPTGITTGGPEGLITVSRTGSGDYTLWKNRVPTKTSLPASVPQSQSIYLNAANVSNVLFSGSQNNVSYASVGAGLTDSEVYTYYELVDNLQTNLGRSKSTNPNAFITTWDTRISGTGTVTGTSSIALPLFGTQAITASWGDGTTSIISSSAQVDRTHSYATPGVYTVSITGTGQGFRFNNGGDRNKLMDIGQWGSISGSADAGFYGSSNLVGTAADALTIETTSLSSAFQNATRFNGYLNNWRPVSCSSFAYMFSEASAFNQPLGNWALATTGSISINTSNMFSGASSFNQDIGSWNTIRVTNMNGMFFGNGMKFNNGGSDSIKNWNTSNVTNMGYMFWRCAFNQPIGTWNVGNVTNFDYMFWQNPFNQNIGAWNVEKATSMNEMFGYSSFNNSGSSDINNWRPISCSNFSLMFRDSSFNQPVGNWPISASGVNMSSMFQSATAFNQNLGAWDVSKVTSLGGIFQSAASFNNSGSNSINNWRPISCSNFVSMFYGASVFNQPVGNWPLSASNIDMGAMFRGSSFNQNLGSWDVSRVTSFSTIFQQSQFNNSGSTSINNWQINTGSNVSFFQMFYQCPFNQPIGSWNVSKVTNMFSMFENNGGFNQSLENWTPISCSNFSRMFYRSAAFNGSVLNWTLPTSTAFTMDLMFSGINTTDSCKLNQNLSNWNVTKATNLSSMFAFNTSFNNSGSAGINNWTPVSCSNFNSMFLSSSAFNQPVEGWTLPTDRTYTMTNMFARATSFNQPLGLWNVVSCSSMAGMLDNCGMNINNYSQTLIGWASQPSALIPRSIILGATGRQYDTPGSASRAILTSSPYNWTITGDTYVP